MLRRRWRLVLVSLCALVLLALGVAESQLPTIGASGLLHPVRRRVVVTTPPVCQDETFAGSGVALKGWRCNSSGAPRATVLYLHGVADNRSSGRGVIERFSTRGFDVVAYDSRAHGESGGDTCTYGFFEKQDLQRVLDTVRPAPIVLLGNSLGAAVALQQAARDARVTAVVAAETFSDLRTVASERAPFVFTSTVIARAFEVAERQGRFEVDAVSPVAAASQIKAPVLLIHGADDRETPPDHSRRVLAALAGPKKLIFVPGARHNESLRSDVWSEIDKWLDEALSLGKRGLRTPDFQPRTTNDELRTTR